MFGKLVQPFKPRMRPSLIIIGAQKGGTSSLYQMLRQHPKVLAPEVKELHFFDRDGEYAKGLDHYWQQFPRRPIREGGMITFEASPSYLFLASTTAPRIAQALPGVQCLAMLRDPVKRAYSAWNMYRDFKDRPGYDHLHDERTFAQAVEEELAGKEIPWYKRYLARGHYSSQLETFFEHIPKERVMVHSFLEMKHAAHELLGKICARVGLQNMPAGAMVFSAKANARSYPHPMDPVLEEELYAYYAPEIGRLEKVLGKKMDLIERRAEPAKGNN